MTDYYRTITMDPNWAEYGGGGRGANNHYDLQSVHEIWRTIVSAPVWRPHPNGCHLWMWFTVGHTLEAFSLVDRLGFTYKTQGVWVKGEEITECEECREPYDEDEWHDTDAPGCPFCGWDKERTAAILEPPGLGQYMRFDHELFLLATRGKAMMPEKGTQPNSVLVAPTGEHSAKPDVWYERYPGKVSPGPRLAMYERKHRPGFEVWGDQAPADG